MSAIPQPTIDQFIYPIFQQQIAEGKDELELRVSHSSMAGAFASCARKFEFGKLFLYSREDTDEEEGNLAGEVGHCLHAGYQRYIIDRDKEAAIAAMMLRYPILLNDNPMNVRSVEACYATLQAMMQLPAMDFYEVAKIKKPNGEIAPAIEVPFEIRLRDFPLDYCGRKVFVIYTGYIDLILWDHTAGEYHVVDIKTTRNNVEDKTGEYWVDEQALPYDLVVSQLVGQSITALDVHYLSAFVDILEPKVRLYDFKKSKEDVQDWALGLYTRLKELQWFMDRNWFRRTGKSCMNFKKNCRYMEVCHYRDPNAIVHFMDTHDKNTKIEPAEPWIKIDLKLAA